MTDVGVHPITFASGATERVRRFAVELERSARNEAMARSTYYALHELPDGVLRDMGVARSEIPFVAASLGSRHCRQSEDGPGRSATVRGAASRLALVAVLAVSTFAVAAACTVLALDARVSHSKTEVMQLFGGPEADFPYGSGPATRQLLF